MADQGNDETLLVTAVGLCFTFSLLAAKAGYSVALGAFLAGMMVAESGRERKVEHLLQPVRDMFVAVFFVSIGMLIDPAQLAPNWRALLAFGALVLVGKFASAALGALLGGNSLPLAAHRGQPGADRGVQLHHRGPGASSSGRWAPPSSPVLVATCTWTTLTTPCSSATRRAWRTASNSGCPGPCATS
ncbi:MAG: cation:proton antiporter [Holophagaceae bacterium]|nr:cation:proton antiporter [Holophagaceae bacterium]